MEGGGGDDLYYVDSLGDVIVETEDEAPSFPMAMAMQLSRDATTSSVGSQERLVFPQWANILIAMATRWPPASTLI